VEMVHDKLVAQLWPGTQPINVDEPRSLELLSSALACPFQSACGIDIYPTALEKGAAMFRSLNADHCFMNGNKRTAVIALDLFLVANGYGLALQNDEMFELARETARYKERGITDEEVLRNILNTIGGEVQTFDKILEEAQLSENAQFEKLHEKLSRMQARVRSDSRNKIMLYL
jgi:death-on-curing family protein